MRSRLTWKILLPTLFVTGCFAQACSSTSATPAPTYESCASDPNACGAGFTCWPKDCTCDPGVDCTAANCTAHLTCLPAPATPTKPHDSCVNTIGTPTCSDHQTCVEFEVGKGGCLTYCDETKVNHGCAEIETCVDLRAGATADSPVVHVCAVLEPDAAAFDSGGGIDAGDGGTDEGGLIFDATLDHPI